MHSLTGRSRVLGTLPSRGLPGWLDTCFPPRQTSRAFAGVWWIWHGLPREPDLETKVRCWNLHSQLPKNWNLNLLLWLLGSFAGPRNVWLVELLPTLRWRSQLPHDGTSNCLLQIVLEHPFSISPHLTSVGTEKGTSKIKLQSKWLETNKTSSFTHRTTSNTSKSKHIRHLIRSFLHLS